MQYRTLGKTGLQVSEIGFGTAPAGISNYIDAWDAETADAEASVVNALHRAIDLGVNYIDTAPGYGAGRSERWIGKAIAGKRDRLYLATKTGARDPQGIRKSVEESLTRLQTDYLDLVQFHGGWYDDNDVRAILERGGLETYLRLKEEGKVRFIGFTAEGPSGGVSQLIATDRFDVLQTRYNWLNQLTCDFINADGIILEAKDRNMGVVIMRTLTSGLAQKLLRAACPTIDQHMDVDGFLLNMVLSNPYLDVAIIGMRRVEEAEKNAARSDDTAARVDLVALHAGLGGLRRTLHGFGDQA